MPWPPKLPEAHSLALLPAAQLLGVHDALGACERAGKLRAAQARLNGLGVRDGSVSGLGLRVLGFGCLVSGGSAVHLRVNSGLSGTGCGRAVKYVGRKFRFIHKSLA